MKADVQEFGKWHLPEKFSPRASANHSYSCLQVSNIINKVSKWLRIEWEVDKWILWRKTSEYKPVHRRHSEVLTWCEIITFWTWPNGEYVLICLGIYPFLHLQPMWLKQRWLYAQYHLSHVFSISTHQLHGLKNVYGFPCDQSLTSENLHWGEWKEDQFLLWEYKGEVRWELLMAIFPTTY